MTLLILSWSGTDRRVGIWAIYSTVRYLWAFTIYESVTGQAVSLALAASTGLSFAFAACASFLYMAQTSLLVNGFSVNALVSLRAMLHYLSSCCLFGPSVANLILILVWRKTTDLELQVKHRCRLDVDLVWSISYSLCNRRLRNWGVWVTLSVVRLVLTLIIIVSQSADGSAHGLIIVQIAFHSVVSSSQFVPVRRHRKPRYARSKKSHTRLDSCQTPLMPENSSTSVALSHSSQEQDSQRQSSDITSSGKSSPRNRLRPTRSRSSASSLEGGQAPSYNNPNFISMPYESRDSEREASTFTDRFRALISQLTRETEEALAFARSDGSSERTLDSPPLNYPHDAAEAMEDGRHRQFFDNDEDDFFTASPAHNLSSADYYDTQPAEEHIRMLNGYVRRMPTIESMGSKEWRSSIGASSQNTNKDKERPSSSRQPTRRARLSWADTELSVSSGDGHSRSNSLTAQAELLVGMFGRANASEVGELMRRGETIRMVDGQSATSDHSEALGEGYASTTSGSKDSYHTASTGNTIGSSKDAVHPSPLGLPEVGEPEVKGPESS